MHPVALKTSVPSDDDVLELSRLDKKRAAELQTILNEAKGKSLEDAKVVTRHDATVALRLVDGAIDYALDQATTIGAYISRLEYTESNLVIADENTRASESTIRDADMAAAMVSYTKNNVLLQASQSMLAQANQNSSEVLSLLS